MSSQDVKQNGKIKSRFDKLDAKRRGVLDRARACAELTLPAVLPPEGHTEDEQLPTPYQGLGARAVNNLASKLLLALLPPNQSFFKLTVPQDMLAELSAQGKKFGDIQDALSQIERAVTEYIEIKALRVPNFESLKNLIITGNSLEVYPKDGGMKVYRLDQYVVKRDGMGNVLEVLVKDTLHPTSLPKELQARAEAELKNNDERVEVYTHVVVKRDKWFLEQEMLGEPIASSKSEGPRQTLPYLALRWSSIFGEDYGRGLVEEYLGDLRTLESLEMAIVEASAAAAKVIFLVDPNAGTNPKLLDKIQNGGFAEGKRELIGALQMDKYNDFRIAFEKLQATERRLSQAFMLFDSVQRDAERVTAEEIRLLAQELENSLGGVYSILALEKMYPMVTRIIHLMTQDNSLPPMPDKIKPVITTGFDALGRGYDLQKLRMFISLISETFGPDETKLRINSGEFSSRAAAALGIDTKDLVRSDDEVNDTLQQQQAAQMIEKLGSGPATEMTKAVMNPQQQ